MIPRFEVPIGAIDGVNATFYVTFSYSSGSTAVYLNGVLQEPTLEDGWVESDPMNGEVTLNAAPKVGDVLQIFYLQDSPGVTDPPLTGFVEFIHGTIQASGTLSGVLSAQESLGGSVGSLEGLLGTMQGDGTLVGVVEPEGALEGVLEAC